MKYCKPKKHTSGYLPPRHSKYEYTFVVPGGYCKWCVTLYESVNMTMLLRGSPGMPTDNSFGNGVAACFSPFERARIVLKSWSIKILPSLNTSTSSSFVSSPLPSVTVAHSPSPVSSNVKRPFLDFLPGSVIGSLTTSRAWPPTSAYEHLNAHFCVSRWSFCNNAPPLPKARLSAAHPFFFISSKITSKLLISIPSPWMTRM
mmetsp:Transcript_80016/g.244637  ORF Transcript_80016/g.244637 Transcript_80016/m.244637 type:complete len:202 (+) Transcript_80016:578-1183(+)